MDKFLASRSKNVIIDFGRKKRKRKLLMFSKYKKSRRIAMILIYTFKHGMLYVCRNFILIQRYCIAIETKKKYKLSSLPLQFQILFSFRHVLALDLT